MADNQMLLSLGINLRQLQSDVERVNSILENIRVDETVARFTRSTSTFNAQGELLRRTLSGLTEEGRKMQAVFGGDGGLAAVQIVDADQAAVIKRVAEATRTVLFPAFFRQICALTALHRFDMIKSAFGRNAMSRLRRANFRTRGSRRVFLHILF